MDYFIYLVHYLNRKHFCSFQKLYLVMQQAYHTSRSLFAAAAIFIKVWMSNKRIAVWE